jgi:hypothetical protein
MAVDLERSALFAAGVAMLALAVLILALRPGRGINRALSALVAARGMATLLPQASTDPSWTLMAQTLQPYFTLAVVPLALYCLHAFATLGAPERRWGGAGWLALAAVAILDGLYFLDHSLYQTLEAGEAEVGALRAADGLQYTAFGPLWLLLGATMPVLAYLGLRLAIQYRQQAGAAQGPLLLFVAGGLVIGALFDAANRLAALASLLDHPGPYPWLPWGWATAVLPVLALGPALLAIPVLVAAGRSEPRPLQRSERAIAVLAGFALCSGFLRLVAPADSDVAGNGLVLVLLGTWRLAMPVLIAYALLRHPTRMPDPQPSAAASLQPSAGLDRQPLLR